MLLALFVLIITTLILGAAYVAVLSDTSSGRNRSGPGEARGMLPPRPASPRYNYDLNQDPNFWDTVLPEAARR